MEFFDIMDISHRYLDVLNPSSPEKLLAVGDILELDSSSRIIDFGSGTGETLALWAEEYGISGTGIDISKAFHDRAVRKFTERGMIERFEFINASGREYTPERNDYDAAICIGATFIWDGYRSAIRAMKQTVKPPGRLVIGEACQLKPGLPQEYLDVAGDHFPYEHEILQISREEGYDIEYIVRANLDDWDRYNTGNWHGLLRWIDENPEHPDRRQIIDHLHNEQENYLKYEREYIGWAIYVLNPASY